MTVSVNKVDDWKQHDWGEVIKHTFVANHPSAHSLLTKYMAESKVVYVGRDEDEIACVIGIIVPTLLSESAYIWLLHTHWVERHKFLFVRWSQIMIEKLLKVYPMIVGSTNAKDKIAIRWIEWLGGKFSKEETNGFIHFVIKGKSNG